MYTRQQAGFDSGNPKIRTLQLSYRNYRVLFLEGWDCPNALKNLKGSEEDIHLCFLQGAAQDSCRGTHSLNPKP